MERHISPILPFQLKPNKKVKANQVNKAFSLVEMIISLVILSIVSIYILQMFFAASKQNQRAFEIDRMVNIQKEWMTALTDEKYIDDTVEHFINNHPGVTERKNPYSILAFYDENLQDLVENPEEAYYKVLIEVEPKSPFMMEPKNRYLAEIRICATRLQTNIWSEKIDQTIFEMQSKQVVYLREDAM